MITQTTKVLHTTVLHSKLLVSFRQWNNNIDKHRSDKEKSLMIQKLTNSCNMEFFHYFLLNKLLNFPLSNLSSNFLAPGISISISFYKYPIAPYEIGLTWVDHFQGLFKSSQPAQQVFSKSSVHAGLSVQVKPASSVSLQSMLDWLFKSSQPVQQVFSRRWIDCSSQANQLSKSSISLQSTLDWVFKSSQQVFSKSSVHAGLSVQVKPASSVSLQSTLDWLFKSSQPAQQVFSKSSVDAGLIVQVKPASSASLQSTLDWLFKSSQPAHLILTWYHVSCTDDHRV